jgi:thioredoxin 1
MSDAILNGTDAAFDADVLKSDLPVLVDFWAPWCGPCRAIGPILEDVATQYEGKVNVVKVNVDDNPATASRYGVRSIPTLLLIHGGKVQETQIGLLSKQQLTTMIERHVTSM